MIEKYDTNLNFCYLMQDVFHERVKVYQNWQHSQMMLNKKREAKAKMEIMGRTDKSNQAREEVLEVSCSPPVNQLQRLSGEMARFIFDTH